jgi:flagellar basal-body rod protein FlgB
MAITDLPLFSMLKTRMHWLEQRQKLLAENVANSNTPNYRGRDLKQLDFKSTLEASLGSANAGSAGMNAAGISSAGMSSASVSSAGMGMSVTQPGHLRGGSGTRGFDINPSGGFETTPSQNSVVLEDEMMKVAQTQLDHQTAISLYQRGVGMIKTALGKA